MPRPVNYVRLIENRLKEMGLLNDDGLRVEFASEKIVVLSDSKGGDFFWGSKLYCFLLNLPVARYDDDLDSLWAQIQEFKAGGV